MVLVLSQEYHQKPSERSTSFARPLLDFFDFRQFRFRDVGNLNHIGAVPQGVRALGTPLAVASVQVTIGRATQLPKHADVARQQGRH